ncbi:ABC transporter ATP-binding protein [Paenibacillus sp. ALE2]
MMIKKPSVLRRLTSYILLFRKKMIFALIILLIAVAAQLSGPYITKMVIDRHISSIVELDWYEAGNAEVPEGTKYVDFHDKAYIRADWIATDQLNPEWTKVQLKQQDNTLVITAANAAEEIKLSSNDVVTFYKHDVNPVIQLIGLYASLLIVGGYLSFVSGYMMQSIALRVVRKIRIDAMKHVHRIPVRYFDNTPVGQVVTRITNDTESIKDLFMSFMNNFVVNGVNLVCIYTLMFMLDKTLAALCLIFLPLFFVLMRLHFKFSKGYFQVIRERLSQTNAMINESILVMPIIKAFRREKERVDEFEKLTQDSYVHQMKQLRISSILSQNITNFIGALAVVALLWYFGNASLHTAISFGVLYAFVDYLGRLFAPINGIFEQLTSVQRSLVSAERVFKFIDEDGIDMGAVEEFVRPEGHVAFNHVSFAYKEEEYVLKDISFEVKKGQTIAIVGHTGSGKSSIMNLLLGFYEPNKGSITIDGRDIASMSKQELRKHMGIVLQDPFLFAGDIKFNVSLYNEGIDLERVKQVIREVGAEGFVNGLPNSYDEEVIERGSTLSNGQRQLISFARALAFNPAILLLDEATANIDSETEAIIQKALKVLVKNRTMFIIAHRLSTIRQADCILVMHKGEIIERGNHDELMSLNGRYANMVKLQENSLSLNKNFEYAVLPN